MITRVHKFGGNTTRDEQSISRIISLLTMEKKPLVVTLSASAGITDYLSQLIRHRIKEEKIPEIIDYLKNHHLSLFQSNKDMSSQISEKLKKLERLLYGVAYTEELTLRTQDLIISFGERLISIVLNSALLDGDVRSIIVSPENLIVTDGTFGSSIVELSDSEIQTKKYFDTHRLLSNFDVIIVPGYFGMSKEKFTTLLGRSGTDYTCTALAYSLDAEEVVIWKDVSAFMSADPHFINHAKTISELSYNEAAELTHFGARILHPRSIIPVKKKKIPVEIRNFYNPKTVTLIHQETKLTDPNVIKSISHLDKLAIVRIYVATGGDTSGVLFQIAQKLYQTKISAISIATSQTCISILVYSKVLELAKSQLSMLEGTVIDSLEFVHGIALICVVGDELGDTPGIASRVFKATANAKVNVEMISAGASKAAYHFTVNESDLQNGLQAVHNEFFLERDVVA